MRSYFLALASLLFMTLRTFGQATSGYDDSKITVFDTQPDTTFYSAVDEIFKANAPVSYLAPFPKFSSLRTRTVPLQYGEGMNGYILEGITDLQYTVMQGRRLYANHFFQTGKLSIRYGPGIRMTKDNSSNVLPTNQKIGLQIDKVVWDSYTGNGWKGSRVESYEVSQRNFAMGQETLNLLYVTVSAMHYSNGQAEGVWLDQAKNRNDYMKGDFSTNIITLSLTYARYNLALFSANLGFQKDSDWGGPFAFIAEQKERYGQNRITGYLQFRSKPSRHPLGKKLGYFYLDGKDTVRLNLDRKWEWRSRLDYELILGNLQNYPGTSKYRVSGHLYCEGMPMRSRHIAYIFHIYYGRDYLNIRYDDPVFGIMGGLSFTLARYRNPRFRPSQAIIHTAARIVPTKIEERIKKRKI